LKDREFIHLLIFENYKIDLINLKRNIKETVNFNSYIKIILIMCLVSGLEAKSKFIL